MTVDTTPNANSSNPLSNSAIMGLVGTDTLDTTATTLVDAINEVLTKLNSVNFMRAVDVNSDGHVQLLGFPSA